ncbi:MAG: tetratricopeptide repeat protein, partial [Candidatus Helarchaeales archaeon]
MNLDFYKEVNVDFENLLRDDKKFAVFAGAGISMNPPSNLLSARQIVSYLINLCCPEEEAETILNLPLLRYELVIEAIQLYMDENLNFMNFFDYFERPNAIHYFCAALAISGNDIITTNFDYLIELALMNLIRKAKNIKTIITKDDFTKHEDPEELRKKGFYPICKIHGSKKNIITGEWTTSSLITTISSLGRERESLETFTIEPYKRAFIENSTKNRSLIILGYSGSDDFDLGPTLEELEGVSEIIWINHVFTPSPAGEKQKKGKKRATVPKIYEIRPDLKISELEKIIRADETGPLTSQDKEKDSNSQNSSINEQKLQQIDRVLLNLQLRYKIRGESTKIYRIDADTLNFTEQILWKYLASNIVMPKLEAPDRSIDELLLIIKSLIDEKKRNPFNKYQMGWYLYNQLSDLDGALRCCEKGLEFARKHDDSELEAVFLIKKARIFDKNGRKSEALEIYKRIEEIARKIDNDDLLSTCLINLGDMLKQMGRYKEALRVYNEAEIVISRSSNYNKKPSLLANMALVHNLIGASERAYELYDEALRLNDKIGNLTLKATILNNLGLMKLKEAEVDRSKYEEALSLLKQAIKIDDLLGNLAYKAQRL